MCSRGLLLSVTLLGLIAGGLSQLIFVPSDPVPSGSCPSPSSTVPPNPKCDYIMIVPFKLTSGSQGTVCTWLKCEVPVTVTVDLQYFSEKLPIVSKLVTSEHYDCTEFTVPAIGEETSVFFTFSATGDNFSVADRKAAVIDVSHSACLPQKNKPLYKQSETIKIRMPCYDENLKQVVKNFTKVTLVDPNGARVNQILNPTLDHGVVTVDFLTSERSRLGYWSIQFEDDKGAIEYTSAELQRYELPRFDWKATCPSTISVLDETAEITGNAQYIYGEPVPGTVVVRCCRTVPKYGNEANCFRGINDICQEFTRELDENGTFSESLDLDQFKLPFSGLLNYLTCDITMKENGTGVLVPTSCYMSITNRLAILQLDRGSIGSYYNKVHLPFAATLTDEKGKPLASRAIKVRIDGADVKCLTTDANGRVETVIDTSSYYKANITLSAVYEDNDLCYGRDEYSSYYINNARSNPYDEITLYRSFSKSQSHIRIRPLWDQLSCNMRYSMQVDYLFTEEGVGKGATTTSIKYIFLSNNKIVANGEITVDLSGSYKGSASIEFTVNSTFATRATLLAFVPLMEEVISDTASVNIVACFENEVNMEFTEKVVAPGATVIRKITAAPGSFCGLRARDASFSLINSYDELNPNNVYNRVVSYIFGLQYKDINYADPEPPCIDENTELFCNGVYTKPTSSRTDREAYQDFVGLSIQLASSLGSRRPKVCGLENEPNIPIFKSFAFGDGAGFGGGSGAGGGGPKSRDTIRSDFRDSFGDETVIIGPDGEATVSSIIPQSVTNWESDGFCISANEGLGLTIELAKTTTIQPFFVESSIPSYVIRGEEVIASIVVSNYLNKSAQVEIEVDGSENYQVTPLDDKLQQCVGSQQKVFWTVAITFIKTGKLNIGITARTMKISDTCDGANDDSQPSYSDKIILKVNSEPEGIKREESSSHLVTVSDSTIEVEVSVDEPVDLVPDSFVLTVNVMGDPVALAAENYDNLLSTPSGCCDQLQGSVIPLIFLSEYLKDIGELSDDRSKKMLAKLSTGYMDMITCQQYDGGFSRYPSTYEISSWGTMLSLRTIFYLDNYIYIDKQISTQTLIYISRTQDLESGCLNPVGYWSIYQENVNATIQYNALAASILQEISLKYSVAGPLLDGVKRCLNNADFTSQNTLTQSYMLIAAAAVEDWDMWQTYYDALDSKSTSNGDTLYWRNDNEAKLVLYQYFPTSSDGDVLITSSILIGMTKHPNPSQDLLNKMGSAAKWLSGRMTRYGGFYASQLTSSATEALTLFGRKINSNETNVVVSLRQNDTEVFNVAINKQNRFLIRSQEISFPFANYKFIVTGTGSPFVQLSTTYNTKIAKGEDSAFEMTAQATALDCFSGVARKLDVTVSIRYTGDRDESGDTIVSVDILTGYRADFSSISQIPSIKDYRMDGNKVHLYLSSVNGTATEFTLATYLQNRVSIFQTASVVAQEIVTGETGGARYTYPCNSL
ncbi:ovostatin-like isoform X2 [Rana temporaria]|uniref:ovostatin-like isoform X2 n=1 Tax=Rana temporaria TaxID=8407 RepID=UPI001AAC6845|nr:ovostatin-like isoform X2 [Rana temporaria]